MKNKNISRGTEKPLHPEDNKKKWEANINDQFIKFKDLDINTAHQSEISKLVQSKIKIDEFNKNVIRKSMIRYLTLVIDFSKATLKQDFGPNRASAIKSLVSEFIS